MNQPTIELLKSQNIFLDLEEFNFLAKLYGNDLSAIQIRLDGDKLSYTLIDSARVSLSHVNTNGVYAIPSDLQSVERVTQIETKNEKFCPPIKPDSLINLYYENSFTIKYKTFKEIFKDVPTSCDTVLIEWVKESGENAPIKLRFIFSVGKTEITKELEQPDFTYKMDGYSRNDSWNEQGVFAVRYFKSLVKAKIGDELTFSLRSDNPLKIETERIKGKDCHTQYVQFIAPRIEEDE